MTAAAPPHVIELDARTATPFVDASRWQILARATAGPCLAAIWVFASHYTGIDGDARIYMARAMADLDPDGVGRDLMFAQDGQSAFSVFRLIAAKLVALLGLSDTALVLAFLNTAVWFSAMSALARCFAKGRAFCVLMIFAAVLPCCYGFYPLMMAREIIAVPRPLSEAAVLFALAALCVGRPLVSFLLLGLAALLHPIMALPGFGVVLIVLGLRDRRWFAVIGASFVVAAVAAAAGLPLFARLATAIDPAWKSVLVDRNPYLFVTSWTRESLAPLTVQAASLLIAALLTGGRPRLVLLVSLAVAFAGVLASWVLGDELSLLLVVQAQPWRALWLVAALAMPAFAIGTLELPKRGAYGQLALAFLAFAWITFDIMPVSPLAALMALGLAQASTTRRPVFSRSFVPLVWAVVIVLALTFKWRDATFAWAYLHEMPPLKTDWTGPLWRCGLLPVPILAATLAWVHGPRVRFAPGLAAALSIALAFAIAVTWDGRPPLAKRAENPVHDAALVAMTAAKPGEVLWLDGDGSWYWLGRPQWNSFIQGAGIVFSRPLAIAWRERTETLIALGVVDDDRLRPWRSSARTIMPRLTEAAVRSLCSRPDAPAWIVAPEPNVAAMPVGLQGTTWHAPVPQAVGAMIDGHMRWSIYDSYAVIPCAGFPAGGPGLSLK